MTRRSSSSAYCTGSAYCRPVRAPVYRRSSNDSDNTRCAGERSSQSTTRLTQGPPRGATSSRAGRNSPVTAPIASPARMPVAAPSASSWGQGQGTDGTEAPVMITAMAAAQPRALAVTQLRGRATCPRSTPAWAAPKIAPSTRPIAAPASGMSHSGGPAAELVPPPVPSRQATRAGNAMPSAQPSTATATVTSTHRRPGSRGSQGRSTQSWTRPTARPSTAPPAMEPNQTASALGQSSGSPTVASSSPATPAAAAMPTVSATPQASVHRRHAGGGRGAVDGAVTPPGSTAGHQRTRARSSRDPGTPARAPTRVRFPGSPGGRVSGASYRTTRPPRSGSTSTTTSAPSRSCPDSSARASRSPISVCTSRLSGRAPYSGS